MTQKQSLWLIYLLALGLLPVPFFLIFKIAFLPIFYLAIGNSIALLQDWRIGGGALFILIHSVLWMVALYFILKFLTRLMFRQSKVIANTIVSLFAIVILALGLLPIHDGGPVPPPKISALTLYERAFSTF